KLQEVFQTPYQQYQAQPGQAQGPQQHYQQAPPQYQQPPQQYQQAPPPAAPVEERKPQKVDMVKCKNCGVQYPAFMHHCPNCNTPR
ncbi:MAG TPA: hypothetical protein VLH13_03045, partial [Methanomassiliicoccales archaeon]|nr:hypothetical protein [Methanomassiliicoccales archaeon]